MIAATTAFLTLSLAAQAGAAPTAGFERCPPGHLCLFDGFNGTGEIATFRWGSPDLRLQNMDNRASSVANTTGRQWCLFDGTNYTGSRRDIIPSTDLAGRWDNRVSSLRSGLCPA